jgi:serine/threonine-protein kinase
MMMTETGTLKVMDFGIARVLGTSRMTRQGNIVGTIEYMSPEQVRGQETDARSDIYSLGILLYEMLTGRVPFSSDSEYDLMQMQIETAPQPPRMFSAQIPVAVEQAIMRALAKRAEARFQGAADFRNALLWAGSAPTVVAPQVSAQQTQINGAPNAATPMPGQPPQQTRIAAGVSQADQIKQTRLASEMNPSFAYGGAQPPAGMYPPAPMPPAAKSNVKLFIGMAAALFVVLVGAAVVLLTIGKQPSPPPSSTPNQPVQSAAPVTPRPAGADQPSLPPQAPPQTNPQVDLTKPAGDSLSGGTVPVADNTNAARGPKPARKESGADTAARRESSAEAAARKEKERKAAEARRLLNQ